MTLVIWLTFLLTSLTVALTVLLFWISFFLLTLVFVLQWLSLHWEILIILFSQFLLTFHHIHKGMSCFIALLMAVLVLIGMVFKIFKLSASAAASEFCEWVQAGIDAYIPHRVKTHSGPCFLATCTDVIVHRNPFFRLYQKNKSSESKVKFRWAINRFKSVLQAAKFVYTNKTKRFCNSQDG